MDKKALKVIADAMLEKKGQDVVSLDLKPIGTAISDYFIVCNADSTPNVVAIADNVEERMIEKCKRKVIRTWKALPISILMRSAVRSPIVRL